MPADGQGGRIERFLTPESIRLGLWGIVTASVAGLTWRVLGRREWGAAPFVLAVLAAATMAGRSDWPRWENPTFLALLLTVLAGAGAANLLADPFIGWGWIAGGAAISAAGVYAGAPETGPAVLVGSSLVGISVTTAVTASRWSSAAGIGLAAVLGWAALSGAAGRSSAIFGGALCVGVPPWLALRPLFPTFSWSRRPGLWLLGGHLVLVALAARWVAVVPHVGWQRPTVVVVVGLAMASATRLRP